MTQWRRTQREHGAGARFLSRAMATVFTLGLAFVGALVPMQATAHPLRAHSAEAMQQAHGGQTDRARSRSTVYKSTGSRNASTRSASSRIAASSVAAHRSEAAATQGAHPRQKAARHRGAKHTTGHAKPGPKQISQEGSAPATAGKALTVDDFLHATNSPAAAANSATPTGAAHAEHELSVAAPHAPLAVLEAAPAESHSGAIAAAPSDLVGAPLTPVRSAAEPARRTRRMRVSSPEPALAAPSREEIAEEVEQPIVLPGLYRNGRLVVPHPLKGSREILVHQNTMADDEGLNRIQDNDDLQRMRGARLLVDFPETSGLHLNPELTGDRRCARPWTVRFAADISRSYYARFHAPLQVNSAARTVAYQTRLRRVNGNAAGTDGDVASPHLTGQAIDFGKHGMTTAQIAWMRLYLLPLMQSGQVDVEEEFQQACFHISVYRNYDSSQGTRRRVLAKNDSAPLHTDLDR